MPRNQAHTPASTPETPASPSLLQQLVTTVRADAELLAAKWWQTGLDDGRSRFLLRPTSCPAYQAHMRRHYQQQAQRQRGYRQPTRSLLDLARDPATEAAMRTGFRDILIAGCELATAGPLATHTLTPNTPDQATLPATLPHRCLDVEAQSPQGTYQLLLPDEDYTLQGRQLHRLQDPPWHHPLRITHPPAVGVYDPTDPTATNLRREDFLQLLTEILQLDRVFDQLKACAAAETEYRAALAREAEKNCSRAFAGL